MNLQILIVLLLSSTAVASAADDDALPDGYRATGARVDCIRVLSRPEEMIILDENQILIKSGGDYYLNRLVGHCRNIDSVFHHMEREGRSTQYCRNDRLSVVDSAFGLTAGFCRFGEFQELEKVGSPKS